MPEEKHEAVEGVLGEMLGVAQLIEDGNRAPILPQDLRMWAERIKEAVVQERACHKAFVDGLVLACDHLREERDRDAKYDDAAQHPGSASWKEMQTAFAAAKERKPEENYGNVAELRKTLEDAHHLIEAFLATVGDRAMKHEFLEMRYRIQDALAAPPRNCDKYSLDDIKKMDRDFGAFCHNFPGHCTGCPIEPMDNLCCHSTWMLMPAEGGAS